MSTQSAAKAWADEESPQTSPPERGTVPHSWMRSKMRSLRRGRVRGRRARGGETFWKPGSVRSSDQSKGSIEAIDGARKAPEEERGMGTYTANFGMESSITSDSIASLQLQLAKGVSRPRYSSICGGRGGSEGPERRGEAQG